MKTPEPARTIHHLRVHLAGTSPAVWRRIELDSGATLADVHAAIVASMPWEGSAHHEFFAAEKRWGARALRREQGLEEEKKGVLRKVAPTVGDRFEYEYDFDDEWFHEVVVEAIEAPAQGASYPRTVDGEGAAPLEGCGGPTAWLELLEARGDEDPALRQEAEELLGAGFDPEALPASLGVTAAPRPGDVPASPAELAAVLERFGPLLTRRLERRVVELGEGAGSALVELLAGAPAGEEDEPRAWAHLQAMRLVGLLRHAPAVPALVAVLERADLGSTSGQTAAEALIAIGAPALEPVLAAQARATEPDRRGVLTLLLGHLGARDERVLALLLAELEADPAGAGDALGQYGDARAAEPVAKRLDAAIAGSEHPEAVFVLAAVLQHLGKVLSPAQAKAYADAEAALAALDEEEEADEDEGDDEDEDEDEDDA